MISLANIPMIVLFGPTNKEKFAKNNFTTILIQKKCTILKRLTL